MLSLVALPLVVASTREGLQAIPQHVREASYAVGKTKAATTRRILLPTARPQVATGAMLGFGRIIGDTAIIVVLLGATQNFDAAGDTFGLKYLRGTGSTLTNFVYQNAPTGDLNQPEKAYAAAFVLLVIVLALNARGRRHPSPRPRGSAHGVPEPAPVRRLPRDNPPAAREAPVAHAPVDRNGDGPARARRLRRRPQPTDRRAAVLDPPDGDRRRLGRLRATGWR